MKNIAIIPARSGSKGLKDKNILLLGDKPLLAYTIEAARNSGVFDEIHVSTDSPKYAEIAKLHGAMVPFLRQEILSLDTTSSLDVVRWVLNEYGKKERYFDNVALLQPTSPFRTGEDIAAAYDMFISRNANSVVSVTEAVNPAWCNTLPEDLSLDGFIDTSSQNKPRQQLKQFYVLNGAIYLFKSDFIAKNNNFYQPGSYAYIMSKDRSVDIDDEFDFKIAQACLDLLN